MAPSVLARRAGSGSRKGRLGTVAKGAPWKTWGEGKKIPKGSSGTGGAPSLAKLVQITPITMVYR